MAYFTFNSSLWCTSIHLAGVRYFTNVLGFLMFDMPDCKAHLEENSITSQIMCDNVQECYSQNMCFNGNSKLWNKLYPKIFKKMFLEKYEELTRIK